MLSQIIRTKSKQMIENCSEKYSAISFTARGGLQKFLIAFQAIQVAPISTLG
jgi:hypothetical protein